MDATATPKLKKKELNSGDFPIQQKPDIDLGPIDEPFEHEPDIILQVDGKPLHVSKEYLDDLAFAEEPVKILINRSAEKYPASCVPIWCQGPGAEIFDTQLNRWMRYGALPVGIPCITKRKYIEILAGSKVDSITTEDSKRDENGEPQNKVVRQTSALANFSVLEDKNPRGPEWFARIMYSR